MFKIGDKIKCINAANNNCIAVNHIYTVLAVKNDGETVNVMQDVVHGCDPLRNYDYLSNLFQLINQNNMNLLEKATLAFKSEPEKSLRKSGITNGDDILTDEGVKIFLSWLLRRNADEFKKEVVDVILKEQKDDN